MLRYLTNEDLKEGKEFEQLFSRLPAAEKIQVKIYTQALADRDEIQREQTVSEQEGQDGNTIY